MSGVIDGNRRLLNSMIVVIGLGLMIWKIEKETRVEVGGTCGFWLMRTMSESNRL